MRTAFVASVVLALLATPRPVDAAPPPWLGVIIVNGGGGAAITEVISGSPADQAGIVPGDIIRRVGGTRIYSANALISTVSALKVGADTEVEIARGKKIETMIVTLSARLTESEILQRRLIDRAFTSFRLTRLAGKGTGDSDDHKGDVVVLYFYSASCKNCSPLNTALEELAVADDVQVIAVVNGSRFAGKAALKSELSAAPTGSTVLHDTDNSLRRALGTLATPVVVVTDRKRQVRYAALGKEIDVEDVQFAVSRALKDETQ